MPQVKEVTGVRSPCQLLYFIYPGSTTFMRSLLAVFEDPEYPAVIHDVVVKTYANVVTKNKRRAL